MHRWVKGHAANYRGDALANEGRESKSQITTKDKEWLNNHNALHDGARLQVLEAQLAYKLILKRK